VRASRAVNPDFPAILTIMAEPRKGVPVFGVIAVLIGAVLGSYAIRLGFSNRASDIEAALAKASAEANKNVPLMLDSETRLDGTSAGPGRVLTYQYTLVNVTKVGGLNTKLFEQAMRPNIIKEYKTTPGLKALRDAEVSMHHRFSDKDGAFIIEIVIAPGDLK
jgi:hypothetical protein